MEGKIECAGRGFLPVLKDAAGGTILQMLLRLTEGVLPFSRKFAPCAGTHEEAGKVLLAKNFQAHYASLTTFGHFMGSHQSLSKNSSASESAKLCFIAPGYAFFQRQFMVLVTHQVNKVPVKGGEREFRENPIEGHTGSHS